MEELPVLGSGAATLYSSNTSCFEFAALGKKPNVRKIFRMYATASPLIFNPEFPVTRT